MYGYVQTFYNDLREMDVKFVKIDFTLTIVVILRFFFLFKLCSTIVTNKFTKKKKLKSYVE